MKNQKTWKQIKHEMSQKDVRDRAEGLKRYNAEKVKVRPNDFR